MIINALTVRNALSYGNTPTVIDFSRLSGLVSIMGENGSGKTNFITLIGYALFGETPLCTKSQLVNFNNQSDFYVCLNAYTENFGNIEIVRTINPDSIKITGDRIDQSLQKHGVKKINKFIEDEIVGMSQELFLNTILISATRFKSFLNMNAANKTQIIDQLFGTTMFSDMLAITKKDCKTYNDEIKSIDTLIADKIKQQEELTNKIKNIQAINPNDVSVKIEETANEIKQLELNKSNLLQQLSILMSESAQLTSLQTKINSDKSKAIFHLNQNKNNSLKDITKLSSNENYSIETKVNSEAKTKNELLLSEYNKNVYDIDSILNSKTEEYKAVLDKVKADTRAVYDSTLSTLKSAYEQDKSIISYSYANKKNEANNLYNQNVKTYTDKIQEIAYSIVLLEAEIAAHKKVRYNLDMEVGILSNKIKLYDKGQCSECGIDLHTTEYHINKKLETQKELDDKTILLNESRATVDRLTNDLKEKLALKEDNNTNLNKEQFKHEALLLKLSNDEKSEINILDAKFKDDKQKLIDAGVATVDAAKAVYDNSVKVISDECSSNKAKLFKEYTEKKDSNDSEARNKILVEQNAITEKYSKLIENKTIEFDLLIKNESDTFDVSLKETTDNLNIKNLELSSCRESLAITTNKIELLERQVEVYTLSMKDNNVVAELQNIIAGLESDIVEYCAKQEELKDKLKTANTLSFLLDKGGVKQEFLKKILPQFNNTIRDTCSEIGFRYKVTFNENFDVKITWMNSNFDYNISSGQEAVVNLAIMLASVKMIMKRENGSNIIFLDELFSHVSPAIIDMAIQMLSRFAKAYGVTIYIVSHTPIPMAHVDSIIHVEHVDYFSVMTVNYNK